MKQKSETWQHPADLNYWPCLLCKVLSPHLCSFCLLCLESLLTLPKQILPLLRGSKQKHHLLSPAWTAPGQQQSPNPGNCALRFLIAIHANQHFSQVSPSMMSFLKARVPATPLYSAKRVCEMNHIFEKWITISLINAFQDKIMLFSY